MKFRLLSDQFEKKKTWIYYDQMADAEYNFRQCSFLLEFHNWQTVLSPKHPLYTDQIFYFDYLDLYGF